MPTDEWLCSKMGKLNLTLTEGYPSRSSEAGGLLKDQFVRPPRSQAKWYSFAPNQEKPGQDTGKTVSAWSTDASKINSTYSRIAKAAGIASTPPASRQSLKITYAGGRSLPAKPLPFATKRQPSTGVFTKFKTLCNLN